jgi:hypothetical protein
MGHLWAILLHIGTPSPRHHLLQSHLSRCFHSHLSSCPLFTNYASQCQGQAGTSRDKAGTIRAKQRQEGTSRDLPCLSLFCICMSLSVPVCPFLSLSVLVCPCLSMAVLVCLCLSLSVPGCPWLSLSVHVCRAPEEHEASIKDSEFRRPGLGVTVLGLHTAT